MKMASCAASKITRKRSSLSLRAFCRRWRSVTSRTCSAARITCPDSSQDGESAEFPGPAVQEIDLFGLLRLTGGEDLQDMAVLARAVPVMINPVALGPAPPGLFRHHVGLMPVAHDDVEVPVDDGEQIRNGAEDVAQNGVGWAPGSLPASGQSGASGRWARPPGPPAGRRWPGRAPGGRSPTRAGRPRAWPRPGPGAPETAVPDLQGPVA